LTVAECLGIAGAIAGVVCAVPILYGAVYLLCTDPRSLEERHDINMKVIRGHLNPVRAAWEKFLRWCRTYSNEPLTFDQWVARHIKCRLEGHDLVKIEQVTDDYYGKCQKCNHTFGAGSLERLQEMAANREHVRISPMYIHTRLRKLKKP
jgi:hypothetical protein